MMKSKKN